MEARIPRAALFAAVLLASMGAKFQTPNFIIETADPKLAEQFGKAAQQYRRELAISWLGKPMPDWAQSCVVTAQVGPTLGAGGATTFVFDRGEVFGWRMTIQGSAERILDSVLPHEITHMIFASHFRRPLPRWADEGGATSVEYAGERNKQYKMLVQFLRTGRGISFNQMFAMKQYPRDIMPLYAQGFTLTDFLIQQGGRRQFLGFLAQGMEGDQWAPAAQRHYGFDSVGALQNAWLVWVRQGFPRIQPPETKPDTLIADGRRPRPEPNLLLRFDRPDRAGEVSNDVAPIADTAFTSTPDSRVVPAGADLVATKASPSKVLPQSGWYVPGAQPPETLPEASTAASPAEPVRTQVTHPQAMEPSRQIILEWEKR